MQKKGLKINEAGGNTTQLLIMNEHIKNLLYENDHGSMCNRWSGLYSLAV